MAKKRESRRQLRIQKALRREYGEELFIFKVHGGPFMAAGLPDLIGCVRGLFFAFEVKEPDGTPSALQLEIIADIIKAGGCAGIVVEPEDAIDFIDRAMAAARKSQRLRSR